MNSATSLTRFWIHEERLVEAQAYADGHGWTFTETRTGVEFSDAEGYPTEIWDWE